MVSNVIVASKLGSLRLHSRFLYELERAPMPEEVQAVPEGHDSETKKSQ